MRPSGPSPRGRRGRQSRRPGPVARHHWAMPLTLVLGPANSAKAGEVLGAYAAAAQRGALLVVPTALDADHYARELAAGGAVLGSVLTFAGWRPRSRGARATAAGGCRRCSASGCCERALDRRVRSARRAFGDGAGLRGRRRRADRRARALAGHARSGSRRRCDAWAAAGLRGGWRTRDDVAAIYRAYVARARARGSGRRRAVRVAGARRAACRPRPVGRPSRCSSTASTI